MAKGTATAAPSDLGFGDVDEKEEGCQMLMRKRKVALRRILFLIKTERCSGI